MLLNDVALAKTRLDEGESADTGEGDYHGPVLMIAANLGHVAIVGLLLDRGANVEATDDLGQRSLMIAARYGKTEVVHHLINRGADINAVDWSGQTALSNAAANGHEEIYRTLLSQGAQRSIVDALARKDLSLFETLLDEELRKRSRIDRISDGTARIAMFAAGRGDVDALRILLDRGASHLDDHFDSHSLLAHAAKSGHVEAVQFLIDRGADLDAVGKDQLTALEWAHHEGQQDVIQILERAGATH
ncbi:ankyrin repeat domain-containing protein [Singulisphaera rosea]